MELAGNAARDNHKKRITPRHISLAVGNDEEFNKLFKESKVILPAGGVLPTNVFLPPLSTLQRKREDQKQEGKRKVRNQKAKERRLKKKEDKKPMLHVKVTTKKE
jgi:hypothetical protein